MIPPLCDKDSIGPPFLQYLEMLRKFLPNGRATSNPYHNVPKILYETSKYTTICLWQFLNMRLFFHIIPYPYHQLHLPQLLTPSLPHLTALPLSMSPLPLHWHSHHHYPHLQLIHWFDCLPSNLLDQLELRPSR